MLVDRRRDLEQCGCKVVITAFTTLGSAKKWMDANRFPYSMMADPEMEFYRALGLKRSVKRTYKMEIMAKYASYVIANIPIGPSRPYPEDDLYLMAGDFIANSSGKLVYAYNAQHAHDRPSIEEILGSLDSTSI